MRYIIEVKMEMKLQKMYVLRTLIDTYYEDYGAGGNLHIVLDDDNYENENIISCLKDCVKGNDYIGITIGKLLLEFNEEERDYIMNGDIIETYKNKIDEEYNERYTKG